MFKWNATSTTPAYAALGPAQLNYMVKLAEQLTYRQFVIVSIAGAMTKRGNAAIPDRRSRRPLHYRRLETEAHRAAADLLEPVA